MPMYGPITTAAAVGGNGVAAGTVVTSNVVSGVLLGIYVQYNDAPPAGTTDIGVKTKGAAGVTPSINLLTITNGATDGYYPTRAPTYTAAGALDGGTSCFSIADFIQVDMAGANAADTVSVWLDVI